MISTDKKLFEKGSPVASRQIEFAKKWDEVHIIVFAPKKFSEISISPNVWVYPTRSFSRWLYPFDAGKLGRFIIEKRGITHITTEDSSLTAMAGVSLKKQFNSELEINIHTDIGARHFTDSIENKIRKAMSLSYIPQADKVRVVSNRIKSYLVDSLGIDPSKIEVRPIPVDVDRIRNAPITVDLHSKYPQWRKIVLVASRIEKEKNIELAVNAWPEVISKIPDAGLIIVGRGSQKAYLQQRISRLGVISSVMFEDWVDQATLASYYKTSDVYLLTSLYEGYGLTLVEAQAAGIKIVSTDVGVAAEVGATLADWKKDDVAQKIVYSLGDRNKDQGTSNT